jgi:hypothetical protein
MADETSRILWNNGPIEDTQAWAHEMQRLLDMERDEERSEVDLLKTSLSAQGAQNNHMLIDNDSSRLSFSFLKQCCRSRSSRYLLALCTCT